VIVAALLSVCFVGLLLKDRTARNTAHDTARNTAVTRSRQEQIDLANIGITQRHLAVYKALCTDRERKVVQLTFNVRVLSTKNDYYKTIFRAMEDRVAHRITRDGYYAELSRARVATRQQLQLLREDQSRLMGM
jgi:hypothetical protein